MPSTKWIQAAFYWIGVAMAVTCFVLVLASNTQLLSPLEHTNIPWSWFAGAAAVVAFLLAECIPSDFVVPSRAKSAEVLQG